MKELWVPLSGAIAQQRKIESISNNVANANTPGFKKDDLTFREYMTVLDKGYTDIDLPDREYRPSDFYRSYGQEKSHVKVDGVYTSFKQGRLHPTSNKFDLGLWGKGLFEVQTPHGIRFTRKGTFTLRKDGVMVTDQGHPVLGTLNQKSPEDPVTRILQLPPGEVAINKEGQVFVNGNPVGSVSVIEFKDIHALKKEGNSYFINPDVKNIKPAEEVTTKVFQGHLEESNVNPLSEMAALIKAHRNFETIQKAIKTYDSMAEKTINDLPKY